MNTQVWIPENNAPAFWGENVSRRGFLKFGMSGFLGLIAMQHLHSSSSAAEVAKMMGGAEHCIVLFMNGGPSQLDTFDPKPNSRHAGPFKAIPTSVKGVQFSEHLPQLAEQARHLTIVRSMVSGEGNHDRARFLLHTGYAPSGVVEYPAFGSVTSHYLGNDDFELPNCVNINAPTFSSGFLEAKHDPFLITDPTKPIADINYPPQMDTRRLRERLRMLDGQDSRFLKKHANRNLDAHQATYKKAAMLMDSPRTEAFNLFSEPVAVREAYGMNQFGQGCLMARRLVEAGVKFVEVSLDGWDTHEDNFNQHKDLLQVVDPAFSTLVSDLAQRDLLDKTLVLWLGEFGRTPRINANEGRDHFPNGWTAVLAGGGTRGGQVIGSTNADGTQVVERPVSVPDLFASLCFALNIDHSDQNMSKAGRPIAVVEGGSVVKELFA